MPRPSSAARLAGIFRALGAQLSNAHLVRYQSLAVRAHPRGCRGHRCRLRHREDLLHRAAPGGPGGPPVRAGMVGLLGRARRRGPRGGSAARARRDRAAVPLAADPAGADRPVRARAGRRRVAHEHHRARGQRRRRSHCPARAGGRRSPGSWTSAARGTPARRSSPGAPRPRPRWRSSPRRPAAGRSSPRWCWPWRPSWSAASCARGRSGSGGASATSSPTTSRWSVARCAPATGCPAALSSVLDEAPEPTRREFTRAIADERLGRAAGGQPAVAGRADGEP